MKKNILPLLIFGGVGIMLLSGKKSSAKSNKLEDLPAPDDNGSAQPPAGDGDGDGDEPGGYGGAHPMHDHCMQNGGVETQGWQTPGGGQYSVCVFEDGTVGKTFQFYLDGTKVPPDEGDSRIEMPPPPEKAVPGDNGVTSPALQ